MNTYERADEKVPRCGEWRCGIKLSTQTSL